ncbi:MAG: sugar transferase [Candidatus Parcubacteria bacterium]|jgi:exopolysaccharide biosynthesis polyprenyl glycosylphosphotransferase|nr:MAG: sugar transferase [Candidatus Parcubacteria bacterium]
MKHKRAELFFTTVLVPLDFILIFLAGISAYYLRFSDYYRQVRPVIFDLPINEYWPALLVISALMIPVMFFSGAYSSKRDKQPAKEVVRVVTGASVGLALVTLIIFLQRDLFDSRFIVLATWAFAILYLSIAHPLVNWLQKKMYARGIGVSQAILVGNSKTADNLIAEFSTNKYSGYEVVKRLRDFSLETAQELREFIKDHAVDEVIQADPNLSKAETLRLYDFANENQLTFKYVADLLEIKVLRHEVQEIIGIPVVEVKRTTLEGWGRVAKRIMDLIFSSLLIIILSPVFLFTALAIKLDSRGPVFFSRRDDGTPVTRVGEGGRPFRYFKFRSMRDKVDSMRYNELADRNVRSDGPMVKIKDDPRVTKVGKFIRRFSIDELPELFLVFVGKMSLAGPRPHLPEEVAKYQHHHKKTLTIKPGITGLAQVSGRSDLLFEEEVKLDVYYIENWTLMLDFAILLKTPAAVFKKRQAD